MLDSAFLPATELARRLRRREVSAQALLELYIERIEHHDGAINAVVVHDFERARERARAADAALSEGRLLGPLHGLPMTVKESFDLPGLPTTRGLESLRSNIATRTAVAVQRLLDAGANVFGKTNVPASLADWQSFNPVYGTTRNPWNLACTPGGSSGGSAAALAAGLTALELGTDIGASIRNPAHYCGVWGHKPTWGVVPLEGQQSPGDICIDSLDIAVAGPMARSAHDLVLAMDVLAGTPPRAFGPLGWRPMSWSDDGVPPKRMRVAFINDDAVAEVDASVREPIEALRQFMRDQGVQVSELNAVRPVDSFECWDVYIHLLRAATGARLGDAAYAAAQARAADHEKASNEFPAWHWHANTMTHREWVHYDERRALMRAQWAAFFDDWDLLICPVATSPAFEHAHEGERWERMIRVNGHEQPGTQSLFWAGYSGVVGLPATAVPLGLSPAGLPVGAQIVGPVFGDPVCLRMARWLEEEFRSFVAPPSVQ